jgi:hypothetical protein
MWKDWDPLMTTKEALSMLGMRRPMYSDMADETQFYTSDFQSKIVQSLLASTQADPKLREPAEEFLQESKRIRGYAPALLDCAISKNQ